MSCQYLLNFILKLYITLFVTKCILSDSCFTNNKGAYCSAESMISHRCYFLEGSNITLSCFETKYTEEDFKKFHWEFSSKPNQEFSDLDLVDFENYATNDKYTDVIIKQPETENVTCISDFKDGTTMRKVFVIEKAVQPGDPVLSLDEKVLDNQTLFPVGNYIVNCTADGGIPKPKILLKLNGDTIKMEKLAIDDTMNGQTLFCQVDHMTGCKDSSVLLNISFAPKEIQPVLSTLPKVGQNHILTFTYRANLAVSKHSWSYSNDWENQTGASDFEPRYAMSLSKKVKGEVDQYSVTLNISGVEEEDLKRCFFLGVTNTLGSITMRQCLFAINSDPGGTNTIIISVVVVIVILLFAVVGGVLFKLKYKKNRTDGYSATSPDMNMETTDKDP